MTQAELCFNPLPRPEELRMTPQDKRLYERLIRGPIRNVDIHKEVGLLHYSRRFSTIREQIRPHGWDYRKQFEGDGVFTYYLERQQRRDA